MEAAARAATPEAASASTMEATASAAPVAAATLGKSARYENQGEKCEGKGDVRESHDVEHLLIRGYSHTLQVARAVRL
jgi:hypothetical protein